MPSVSQGLAKVAEALKAALLPARSGVVDADIAAGARKLAPVVWLLGKVQSGKTSLIRVTTGCSSAVPVAA